VRKTLLQGVGGFDDAWHWAIEAGCRADGTVFFDRRASSPWRFTLTLLALGCLTHDFYDEIRVFDWTSQPFKPARRTKAPGQACWHPGIVMVMSLNMR